MSSSGEKILSNHTSWNANVSRSSKRPCTIFISSNNNEKRKRYPVFGKYKFTAKKSNTLIIIIETVSMYFQIVCASFINALVNSSPYLSTRINTRNEFENLDYSLVIQVKKKKKNRESAYINYIYFY